MAEDLTGLAQQLAYLQAGGKQPGQYGLDKVNSGIDLVGSTIKDVLDLKKKSLENKKLGDENKPIGSYFGVKSAQDEAAQNAEISSRNASMGPVNAYPQPSAELESGLPSNVQGPRQQPPNLQGTPQPLVNSRAEFESKYSISPDVPLHSLPEVVKIAALSGQIPMFINDATSQVSFDPKSVLMGYRPFVGLGSKQAGTVAASQSAATVPSPVMTVQAGLDKGVVPKNTKLVTPGQTGETSGNNLDNRINAEALNFYNQMQNNFVLKHLKEQAIGLDTASQLDKLVQSGNTVAASGLGIKEAKGLGEVGVMTDLDVKRYMQSGKISQKAGDILSGWILGRPTDATLGDIQEINGVIKDVLATKVQPIINNYVEALSANLGMTKEEAARRLAVKYIPMKNDVVPPPDLGPEDQVALEWANANPNDQRAIQIKQKLGR